MATVSRSQSLWRHGAFMRVWAGSTISGVGDQITGLALPWLVLLLTHSPVQLGIVVGLQNLPFLLFTLIAGVYADRWDRRVIMLTCDMVRFVALATIPLAAALHNLTMAQIYAVAFITGSGRVWFDVAHYALLPGILAEAQLVDGNSKFFASDGASNLVGPSLGGFLIKLFGAANAILADAFSFLVSAVAIVSLPSLRASEAPAERGWRAQLAAGFRYLFGHRIILENALFLFVFLLFQTMVQAVYVFYAQHELHLDAALTGILFALAGLGPIIIGSLAPRIRRRLRMGQILVLVASLSWIMIAILDVAPLFPKLVALLVVGLTGRPRLRPGHAVERRHHQLSAGDDPEPAHVAGELGAALHQLGGYPPRVGPGRRAHPDHRHPLADCHFRGGSVRHVRGDGPLFRNQEGLIRGPLPTMERGSSEATA